MREPFPLVAVAVCTLVTAFGCGARGASNAADERVETPPAATVDADSKRALDAEFRATLYERSMKEATEAARGSRWDVALRSVTLALEARPRDDAALALQRRLRNARDGAATTGALIDDAAAAYQARLQEQKVRIRRLLDEARAARVAKSWDVAREKVEAAVFVATTGQRLSPGATDEEFDTLADEARRAAEDLEAAAASHRRDEIERRTREALEEVALDEERALLESQTRRATMLSTAIDAFNREDFERAIRKAEQVLAEEPDNELARDLVDNGRRARRRTMSERYLRDLKDSFRRWQVDIERTKTPQSAVLRWPSQRFWDDITRLRVSQGRAAAGRALTDEEAAVLGALRSATIDLGFENRPFPEVVSYLTAATGLNFVVDSRVKGDVEAAEITLRADRIRVEEALRLLMQQVSAEGQIVYEVVGNVVRFIDKAHRKVQKSVQIHPVADLTMGLIDFIPPQITEVGANEDSDVPLFGGQAEEPQTAYGSIEELMELVRGSVRPDVWEEELGTINTQGKNLVVFAPGDVQREVAAFLDDLRAFSNVVVTIESRFLTVTDGFLRDVGVDLRGLGGTNTGPLAVLDDVTSGLDDNASAGFDNGGPGVNAGGAALAPSAGLFFNDGSDGDFRARSENLFSSPLGSALSALGGGTFAVTFIDDLSFSAIIRATEKSARVRELTAPSVTVFNTQRAYLSAVRQVSYVQDFDVEVAQTQFISDPVIGVIQDGLVLDVRPIVSNDRRFVTLEMRPTIVDLQTPIATFQTLLGGSISVVINTVPRTPIIIPGQAPVIIQLPEFTIDSAETTVRIPDGGSILMGGLKRIESKDLKSTTPLLGRIPVLGALFGRQGKSEENEHLMIIVTATITDMREIPNE